jgi:hypothetical protein
LSTSNLRKGPLNEVDKQFIDGGFIGSFLYTYRMILGDFSTDDFGEIASILVLTLFLFCTVLNMIIMLNLLIAIISESFAKINEVSE